MNEYQPQGNPDHDPDAYMAPDWPEDEHATEAAPDLDEPDFSRLRMALASLDTAFPRSDSGDA